MFICETIAKQRRMTGRWRKGCRNVFVSVIALITFIRIEKRCIVGAHYSVDAGSEFHIRVLFRKIYERKISEFSLTSGL